MKLSEFEILSTCLCWFRVREKASCFGYCLLGLLLSGGVSRMREKEKRKAKEARRRRKCHLMTSSMQLPIGNCLKLKVFYKLPFHFFFLPSPSSFSLPPPPFFSFSPFFHLLFLLLFFCSFFIFNCCEI